MRKTLHYALIRFAAMSIAVTFPAGLDLRPRRGAQRLHLRQGVLQREGVPVALLRDLARAPPARHPRLLHEHAAPVVAWQRRHARAGTEQGQEERLQGPGEQEEGHKDDRRRHRRLRDLLDAATGKVGTLKIPSFGKSEGRKIGLWYDVGSTSRPRGRRGGWNE